MFDGGYGSYSICHLCGWEDCPVQLGNPSSSLGPNPRSLVKCQADSLKQWPLSVRHFVFEGDEYTRDATWRPLNSEEIDFFNKECPDGKHLEFKVVELLPQTYWHGGKPIRQNLNE